MARLKPALANAWQTADLLVRRRRGRPPKYLPVLLLFITYRCNLRCLMCGVRANFDHPAPGPELTAEEYRELLRSAQRLGTHLMLISGGETLVRADDVLEIIRCGRACDISAHLCTNALLLDEPLARALQAAGLRSVSVSLESATPDVHDQIRGQGSFARAVEGIRLLRRAAPRIKVGINCTVTAINYRGIENMAPFAESLGAAQIKFAPVHSNLLHRNKPAEEFADLLFSDEQVVDLDREIRALRRRLAQTRLLTNQPVFFDHFAQSFASGGTARCYAGYVTCTINPYGLVGPCPDILGPLSVRDMPLDAIWHGEEFNVLRRRVEMCPCRCWDTLYTEMSLRLGGAARTSLHGLGRIWRDLGFYYGDGVL